MAVMKSEADGKHPASHYLVVEDTSAPSTWHLRVRNMEGALDHRLMGAAWAALHEGYRGNKYAGPEKDKALEKLKALYDREGMEEPGESEGADHMEKCACAMAGMDSEWVWAGLPNNAYQDDGKDILPLALLQEDLERQTKAIADGKLKDYGPLWLNHSDDDGKPLLMEVGRTLFGVVVPGTRMTLEAGSIKTKAAEILSGRVWPMSIGYWYTENAKGYTKIAKYERSVLVAKRPMNTLTFFKVYPREAVTKDVLATF